jgi:hypothetical protein
MKKRRLFLLRSSIRSVRRAPKLSVDDEKADACKAIKVTEGT